MVIGFASGLYFFGRDINEETIANAALIWTRVPVIFGLLGLLLGVLGRLAGTRRKAPTN